MTDLKLVIIKANVRAKDYFVSLFYFLYFYFPTFSCHSRSHLVEAWRGRRSRNFITSPLNMIMIMIMIITIMITTIIISIMIIT